ncbi:Hypothetical protein KVN_LOCUS368 [uncultured virus]|nr:Hypothetical protein KVN_LOCUS368 [uncultured virus]
MVYSYNCLITFVAVVIGIVLLIWIVYPYIVNLISNKEGFWVKKNQSDFLEKNLLTSNSNDIISNKQTDNYYLDDGANNKININNNTCSQSCCYPQWPMPFGLKDDPLVCKNKDNLLPSSMFCQNVDRDSGCLCLTKEQNDFFNNKLGNGSK